METYWLLCFMLRSLHETTTYTGSPRLAFVLLNRRFAASKGPKESVCSRLFACSHIESGVISHKTDQHRLINFRLQKSLQNRLLQVRDLCGGDLQGTTSQDINEGIFFGPCLKHKKSIGLLRVSEKSQKNTHVCRITGTC